jgi:hypothetical protein
MSPVLAATHHPVPTMTTYKRKHQRPRLRQPMQCLPLAPQHRRLQIHIFRLLLRVAQFVCSHVVPAQAEKVAACTYGPVRALDHFSCRHGGEVAIHALLQPVRRQHQRVRSLSFIYFCMYPGTGPWISASVCSSLDRVLKPEGNVLMKACNRYFTPDDSALGSMIKNSVSTFLPSTSSA